MKTISKSLIVRLSVDCVVTCVLLIIASNFFKLFGRPVKRGFFCDDESLKYPYHTDTVNGDVLLILTLYVPICIMTFCEGLLFLVLRQCKTKTAQEQGPLKAFLKLHHNITSFLCGFAVHVCFVHLAKITLGRLRPHFFDVCQPYRSLDGSTCDNPKNHGLYIEDYECSTNNMPYITQSMLNNVHLSFPSGHASYIFYGMIFTTLYLQRFSKTLWHYGSINVGLFLMVVQMLCVLLAWFVAVSRVMDYKHHWSDVLVGIVLGSSIAIAVTQYVCQQLKSVNSWPKGGVKTSISEPTSSTTFAATMPNTNILVP